MRAGLDPEASLLIVLEEVGTVFFTGGVVDTGVDFLMVDVTGDLLSLFSAVAPDVGFLVEVTVLVPLPAVPIAGFTGVFIELPLVLSFFGAFFTGVSVELAAVVGIVACFLTGVALTVGVVEMAVVGFFVVD